jgi:hypothetical protein
MSSSSTHTVYSSWAFTAAYLAGIATLVSSGLGYWLRRLENVVGKWKGRGKDKAKR